MWVTTLGQADRLLSAIVNRRERECGLDCETVGIDPRVEPAAGPKGRIVCWSIAWDEQVAGVWGNQDTWAVLGRLLTNLPVVGHNIWGFDIHMFRKAGVVINPVADTLRLSKLLNPDEEASHGLKSLIKWQLNEEPVGDFKDLFSRRHFLGEEAEGPIKKTYRKIGDEKIPTITGGACSRLGAGFEGIPLDEIPEQYPHLMDVLYQYATMDARATLKLYRKFIARMKDTPWNLPLWTHSSSTPASGTRLAV